MNHYIECKKISCVFCKEIRHIEQVLKVSVRSSNGKMYIMDPHGKGKVGCSHNAIRGLCYLSQSVDVLVTKADLEQFIWQGGIVGMSSLPVLMHEVRYLLNGTDFELVTIRNKGFVFHNAKRKRLNEQEGIIVQQAVNF
ncbi:CadC family transcriptional regulator [Vibrio ouci]|uniref:CadC family transcriptional regulator n=1 Tax=Vibrio ouci TaxID=2499078 RepID=A0A4Y8WBP1_9VIBR|nr:CadC family transcriptional regulator [Vibrio ouci]TFH89701.1 CadC family transcriptional regulator [Vibrio ouci]